MPLPIIWNKKLDDALCRLRREGRSWDAIAGTFGMSRNTALTRGGRLGLCQPKPGAPRLPGIAPDYAPRAVHPSTKKPCDEERLSLSGRPPMAAGDPVAWAVLTEGTLLGGIRYPHVSLDMVAKGIAFERDLWVPPAEPRYEPYYPSRVGRRS